MEHFLKSYRVQEAPPTVLYIPNFISENEEQRIIEKVYNAPRPKWTQLMNRRLQNWGGIPQPNGMISEPLPDWLSVFVDKVNKLNIFDEGKLKANHVLINEYLPGQGIMPHEDGPLFFPTIATVSCGSHTVLEFEKKYGPDEIDGEEGKQLSVLLEPRSLVVIQDSMYTEFLHSISCSEGDSINETIVNLNRTGSKIGELLKRKTRLSLTIRHVPKTTKLKLRLCR